MSRMNSTSLPERERPESFHYGPLLVLMTTILLAPGTVVAEWSTSISRDEMTGKVQAFATSDWVSPTKPMRFPYNDVRGIMGVGCKESDLSGTRSDGTTWTHTSYWAYFKFTDAPNLTNVDVGDGYSTFRTRVRWDDEIETVEMRQTWGAPSIQFRSSTSAIEKISASSSVLLELQWHGSGKVYFEFPLNGSAKALAEAKQACGG